MIIIKNKIISSVKRGTLILDIRHKIKQTLFSRNDINTFCKLSKKYSRFVKNYKYSNTSIRSDTKIWTCWLQGEENAPILIRACIASMRKKFPDKEVVVITRKNLKDYIILPKYILDKNSKGIISDTHLSDIIRLSLLVKYGGIWLDATVFCGDEEGSDFERILNNKKLFVYKNISLTQNRIQPIICSSWLIASNGSSKILKLTRDLLFEYWKHSNYLINYFTLHIFFTIAAQKYKSEWEEIPAFNNVSPHIMQKELNNTYDNRRWEEYNAMSSFHKLNRHIEYARMNSNYTFIIKKASKEEE